MSRNPSLRLLIAIGAFAVVWQLPSSAQTATSKGSHGFEQETASFDFTDLILNGPADPESGDAPLQRKEVPDPPRVDDAQSMAIDPLSFGKMAAQSLASDLALEPDQPGAVGQSPSPVRTFEGLDDNNSSIPPDTMGAVGPNHIMVVSNTEIRILDRNGTQIGFDISIDNWWQAFGSSVDSRFFSADAFDPKILYDPYGQRFFFTACANGRSASAAQMFAVSATNDPTGTWHAVYLDASPSNVAWTDFPSIGFSDKWLVCHVALFPVGTANISFDDRLYVIPRNDAYNNNFSNITVLDRNDLNIIAPARTFDPNLQTHYLLRTFDSSAGTLRLGQLTGPVSNPSFSWVSFVSEIGNTWSFDTPISRNGIVPQLGTSQLVAANDARMRDLIYRNGSLWAVHHVFLPSFNPSRVSVQWWQISTTGGTLQRGLIDDPSGVKDYFFPSMAVNQNNDLLIGYSRGGPDQYISANYATRLGTDSPDVLREEVVFKFGEAPYFKTFDGDRNRWGDYSATQVDPLNDSDFWTIQQYAETPFGGSDRWGLWWALVSPLNAALPTLSFSTSGSAGEQDGAVSITITSDRTVPFDLPVQILRSGTATAADLVFSPSYTPGVTDSISIPAGTNSVTFRMYGVEDDLLEGEEIVILQLVNNAFAYNLGSPSSVTLTVSDSELDQWRFDHFAAAGADPTDPSVSDWDVDFEGDSLPTLFDRGLGLSPTAHDADVAAFKPTLFDATASGPGAYPGISFTRPITGDEQVTFNLMAKDSIDSTSDVFTPIAFTEFVTGDVTAGRETVVLQSDTPMGPAEDNLFLTVEIGLEESLGSVFGPRFQWESGGNVPWAEASTGFDDDSALQLGPLFLGDSSFVETVVEGPSQIDFAWMIERGGGNAEISFEVDGQPIIFKPGNFGWEQRSFTIIPPDPISVRFAFTYDGSSPVGALGMVDNFAVTPINPLEALTNVLNADFNWNVNGAWTIASPGFNSLTAGQLGPIFQNETAFFETTVQGPAIIDFAWRVVRGGGNADLRLQVGNSTVITRPGNFDWEERTYTITDFGSFPVRFELIYDGTSPFGAEALIDAFQAEPRITQLSDAVDTPNQPWITSGDANWFRTTGTSFDGRDSARSGNVDNNEFSSMRTVLTKTSRVTYRWRTSSEPGFDFLVLYINGFFERQISGETGWSFVDLGVLSAGTEIEFSYEKDFSISVLGDSGFVDQVTIVPVN